MSSRPRRPYAARVPAATRREQLLDAAIGIIVRDGYGSVSIEAIAREAGVTRPVVYGVFDGLPGLLGALLDRQEARALEQLAEAFGDGTAALAAPSEVLVEAAGRMVDRLVADPQTWRPILLAPTGTPGEVRERIDRDRELVRRRIATFLELGLAVRGGPAVDVEIASHAALAVMEHFGRLLLEDPARFDRDRLLAALRGLLTSG